MHPVAEPSTHPLPSLRRAGIVNLKPSVAKQEESTSSATQVFFISACQPRSLEVCIHKRCVAVAAACSSVACVLLRDAAVVLTSCPSLHRYRCRRFLCSPGDHFFVPRMTRYSLRNHSKTATATIHFVILSEPAQ